MRTTADHRPHLQDQRGRPAAAAHRAAVAVLNDYPPAAHLATDPRTRAHYQLASTVQYEPGLYGHRGGQGQHRAARRPARRRSTELIRSGVYDELLRRWGLTTGAVASASINGVARREPAPDLATVSSLHTTRGARADDQARRGHRDGPPSAGTDSGGAGRSGGRHPSGAVSIRERLAPAQSEDVGSWPMRWESRRPSSCMPVAPGAERPSTLTCVVVLTAAPGVWPRLEARLNVHRWHASHLFEEVSVRADTYVPALDPAGVDPPAAAPGPSPVEASCGSRSLTDPVARGGRDHQRITRTLKRCGCALEVDAASGRAQASSAHAGRMSHLVDSRWTSAGSGTVRAAGGAGHEGNG